MKVPEGEYVVGPVEVISSFEKPTGKLTPDKVRAILAVVGEVDADFIKASEESFKRKLQSCTDENEAEAWKRTIESRGAAHKAFLAEAGACIKYDDQNPLIHATKILQGSCEVVRAGHVKVLSVGEAVIAEVREALKFVPAIDFSVFKPKKEMPREFVSFSVNDLVPPWSILKELFVAALDAYLEVVAEVARISGSSVKDKCFDTHVALRNTKLDAPVDVKIVDDVVECLKYVDEVVVKNRVPEGTVRRHYNPFNGKQESISRSLSRDKIELYEACDRVFDAFLRSLDMVMSLNIDADAPCVTYPKCDPLWVKKTAKQYEGRDRENFLERIRKQEQEGVQRWHQFLPDSDALHIVLHVFKPEFLKFLDVLGKAVVDEWYAMERKALCERLEWTWNRFLGAADVTLKGDSVCVDLRRVISSFVDHIKMRLQGLPFGIRPEQYESAYAELERVFTDLAKSIASHDAKREEVLPSFESLTCCTHQIISRPWHVALAQYEKFVKDSRIDSIDAKQIADCIGDIVHGAGGEMRYPRNVREALVNIFRFEGRIVYQDGEFNDKVILPVGARAYDVKVLAAIPPTGRHRARVVANLRGRLLAFVRQRASETESRSWVSRRWKSVAASIVGASEGESSEWRWRPYTEAEAEAIVSSVEECASVDCAPENVEAANRARDEVSVRPEMLMEVISQVIRRENADMASQIADALRSKPIDANVVSLSRTGSAQVSVAAQAKRPERDFFSDPNLQVLFEVSVNTPGNWRRGKVTPPEGFLDALDGKDEKAMRACAEKYKASRAKSDAMNTKHIQRDLSEEEIYKESGLLGRRD